MIVFCVGHRSKQPDRRFSSTSLNAWMLCFCGNSDSPSRWFAATASRCDDGENEMVALGTAVVVITFRSGYSYSVCAVKGSPA